MAAVVGMGEREDALSKVGEHSKLKEEPQGSVSVGEGIFPCDRKDGWSITCGVMSIGPVDRTAWTSGELPSLEASQWHGESSNASRVENVKSMKRRGRILQVPTLMGQKERRRSCR